MKAATLKNMLARYPVHDDGLLPKLRVFIRRRFNTSPVIDQIKQIADRYSDSDFVSELEPIEELQIGKLCQYHGIPLKNAEKWELEDLNFIQKLQRDLFSYYVNPHGYKHEDTVKTYEALEELRAHQDLLEAEYFEIVKASKYPICTAKLILAMQENKCISTDIAKLFVTDNFLCLDALISSLPNISGNNVYDVKILSIFLQAHNSFELLLKNAVMLAKEDLLNTTTANMLANASRMNAMRMAIIRLKRKELDVDGSYKTPYSLLSEFAHTATKDEELYNFTCDLADLKILNLYNEETLKVLDPAYRTPSIVRGLWTIRDHGYDPKKYVHFFAKQFSSEHTASVIIMVENLGIMEANEDVLRVRGNLHELYQPMLMLKEKGALNKETFDFIKTFPEGEKAQIVLWLHAVGLANEPNLVSLAQLTENKIRAIFEKIKSIVDSGVTLDQAALDDAIKNVDLALHNWSFFAVMQDKIQSKPTLVVSQEDDVHVPTLT